MIYSPIQPTDKVLIYGYQVEGKSTKQFLIKQGIKNYEIHDDNIEEYSSPKDWKSYDLIIVSAGIPSQALPFSKKEAIISSQTKIFFHSLTLESRKKVIGITGTKGKSTTAQLTHDMLKKAGKKVELAGNIGTGMLDVLTNIDTLDFIVLELSSFQLASLDTPAHIAICTNLLEDHIDWHRTKTNYHRAKQNLWRNQDGGDLLLLPDHQRDLFPQRGTPCLALGPNEVPANSLWEALYARQNFGMVAALADRFDIYDAFQEALKELKTLPHRQETVGTFQEITFIDNAIASNPHSTIADLDFFGEQIGSLIIGGKDRGQNFDRIFRFITKKELDIHLIIPDSETIGVIINSLNDNFPHIKYTDAKDMEEAVQVAFEKTPKGRICLLSPAAASWDKYKSYKEKGEDFVKWVQKQKT